MSDDRALFRRAADFGGALPSARSGPSRPTPTQSLRPGASTVKNGNGDRRQIGAFCWATMQYSMPIENMVLKRLA